MTIIDILLSVHIIINVVIITTIIFYERKSPTASFAWIMACLFLPFVGVVFYVFLSQNIAKFKLRRFTKKEQKKLEKILKIQESKIRNNTNIEFTEIEKKWYSLILLNINYSQSIFNINNEVECYYNGQDLERELLYKIDTATKSIDFEYFIVHNDAEGMRIVEALMNAAKRGVKVRMILDAVGSKDVIRWEEENIRKAGIDLYIFFPPFLKRVNLKLNYRNHRKIMIVDKVAGYIGGFNIGERYVNKHPKYMYWRDTHIKITGDAVRELEKQFILDIRLTKDKNKETIRMDETLNKNGYRQNNIGMQIVSSGPDLSHEEIKHAFLRMITYAEKYIYIQTPYFIPDASTFEALQIAANSGLDVRIMIPTIKDHPFVGPSNRYYVGRLLSDGVKVYFYKKGFLHSKTIVVDDEVSAVGTANFDIRSFKLNFETTAFIYSEKTAVELREQFIKDIENSTEYTMAKYKKRHILTRMKESLCRLFSEIL